MSQVRKAYSRSQSLVFLTGSSWFILDAVVVPVNIRDPRNTWRLPRDRGGSDPEAYMMGFGKLPLSEP